jgi:hypothetical protein
MDLGDVIAFLIGIAGLAAGVIAALVSRRHDREQQARPILLEPATDFARAALRALAAMRYVTPPWSSTDSRRPHRNENLVSDPIGRHERLEICRAALDEVRFDRAAVRLIFSPNSRAAAVSAEVLGELRFVFETAEQFFLEYETANSIGEGEVWRHSTGNEIREAYMLGRSRVYERLDWFFEEVGERLVRPSWNPRKYASDAKISRRTPAA